MHLIRCLLRYSTVMLQLKPLKHAVSQTHA